MLSQIPRRTFACHTNRISNAIKPLSLDALQRPLSIEVKNAAAEVLASRHYQCDKVDDVTQIDSAQGRTDCAG